VKRSQPYTRHKYLLILCVSKLNIALHLASTKVKQSLYTSGQALSLRLPEFVKQSAHESDKSVSLTHWYSFPLEAESKSMSLGIEPATSVLQRSAPNQLRHPHPHHPLCRIPKFPYFVTFIFSWSTYFCNWSLFSYFAK
jgi:hypothetical protein